VSSPDSCCYEGVRARAAFGAMPLPPVVTSIMAGALLTLMISAVPWRLAGPAVFTIDGGAIAAAAKIWLGIFPVSYVTLAGVIGPIAFAVAATVTGLGLLAGHTGWSPGITASNLRMIPSQET
jgi:hypothetical protein